MEPEELHQHEAALAVHLARDDMDGWHAACERINHGLTNGATWANMFIQQKWTEGMVRWFEGNAVHAVDHNPRVTQAWTDTVSRITYDERLNTLLARGLEGISDNEKIALIQGHGPGHAQQLLHSFLVRGYNRGHWTLVSPSWVGAPGTALRQAALDAGWQMRMFPTQMRRQLEALGENPQQTAPTWTSWMAYPHCVAVLYELEHVQKNVQAEIHHFACVPTLPWADPRDVALAQAIADYGPAAFHCVVGDGESACSVQERERLRSLVKVHHALGLWTDLETAVLQGTVDALFVAADKLVLPELGEGPTP